MATFFNVVPLEVRKEISLLESKEVEGLPYHLDFEVMGKDLKWIETLENLRRNNFSITIR